MAKQVSILPYRSTTAAATPSAGDLAVGEMAVNTADRLLFIKDSGSVVRRIGGDFLSPLIWDEISVTSAVTATLGRAHVCSGSSYTLALPDPTGHSGEHLQVRMDAGLTGLVTLDAGSGKTIDGQQTRIMWAREVAHLRAISSTSWAKVGGRTIQMVCTMRVSADATIANATVTKVLIGTVDEDNTGLMADASNKRLVVRRAGWYETIPAASYYVISAYISRGLVRIERNADGTVYKQAEQSALAGTSPRIQLTARLSFATGDTVEMKVYQDSGASQTLAGGSLPSEYQSSLTLIEMPSW